MSALPDLPAGHIRRDYHSDSAGRQPLDSGHTTGDAQTGIAAVDLSPGDQRSRDTLTGLVAGRTSDSAQPDPVDHSTSAAVSPSPAETTNAAVTRDGSSRLALVPPTDAKSGATTVGHPRRSGSSSPGPATSEHPTTILRPSPDPRGYIELRHLARCFHDVQGARKSMGNRTTAKTITKGPDKGKIIPPTIDPAIVAEAIEAQRRAETLLATAVKRKLKMVNPTVHRWAKDTVGIGEHTIALLLGEVGHPCIAWPMHWEGEGDSRHLVADQPFYRTVSQLWAICGHGDPARRKQKGMTAGEAMALGNPRAKEIVHLMAECAEKTIGGATKSGVNRRRSPYRDVYESEKAKYAGRADWTQQHRHNAALHNTAKVILKDLWRVARTDLGLPS
jgi:hypothetical protein